MTITRNYFIAKLAHEINSAYACMLGEVPIAWDDLGAAVQDGVINGVKLALEGKTPEELHLSWVVPYEKLPVAQRIKDHIFRAAVLAAEKLWHQAREAS